MRWKKVAGAVGRVALAGCVVWTFADRIGHPAIVEGTSMSPTLKGDPGDADVVWLSRLYEHRPMIGAVMTFT